MNIHKEEKKCSCEHCGTTFKKKQNLELHMKNVHEGIKDRKCQIVLIYMLIILTDNFR